MERVEVSAESTTSPSAQTPERLRRLTWACRRGMRELDLLLAAFLERRYGHLPVTEQRIFENLLEYPDPLLYDYLMGRQPPTDLITAHVIQQIQRALTD
ncbi:antitoxin CptB [Gammaproteobacteria bacterium]